MKYVRYSLNIFAVSIKQTVKIGMFRGITWSRIVNQNYKSKEFETRFSSHKMPWGLLQNFKV